MTLSPPTHSLAISSLLYLIMILHVILGLLSEPLYVYELEFASSILVSLLYHVYVMSRFVLSSSHRLLAKFTVYVFLALSYFNDTSVMRSAGTIIALDLDEPFDAYTYCI